MQVYKTDQSIETFHRAVYFKDLVLKDGKTNQNMFSLSFAFLYHKNKRKPAGIYAQRGSEAFILCGTLSNLYENFSVKDLESLKIEFSKMIDGIKTHEMLIRNYNLYIKTRGTLKITK